MCDASLKCPISASRLWMWQAVWERPRAEPTGMERAWIEVMAGDTADRPASQKIDASRDTDHTHLHLLRTSGSCLFVLCKKTTNPKTGNIDYTALVLHLWEKWPQIKGHS